MKEIKIESRFNKEDFIHSYKIRWQMELLKANKQLKRLIIASIVFLLLGLIVNLEERSGNPYLLIGFLLSCLVIILLLFRYVVKNRYLKRIRNIAETYEKLKMDCRFEITSDLLKYRDAEKAFEYKWSVFSTYSIYKGYLVLFYKETGAIGFMFNEKEEVSADLLESVKSKLTYKEL